MGDERAELQFEKAEFAEGAPQGLRCAQCASAIADSYYEVAGRTVCDACHRKLRWDHEHGQGSRIGRFVRATAFGTGAGLAGAALWYAVRALTGYEIGLIAVVVGLMVGGAVRAGSGGRGGWRYQALAVFLTYASIVSQYVPDIVSSFVKQAQAETSPKAAAEGGVKPAEPPPSTLGALALLAVGVVLVFGFAFVAPFLGGFENAIGILLIGIALYEAWKINRRRELVVNGPFQVAAPPGPPAT